MKKLIISAMLMASVSASAQDIQLPKVDFTQGSMPVSEALMTRHSVRSYTKATLTHQQIGDVCWAACGQQRDDKHITAPTAMNRQEIRLFVFTDEAVYEYKVKEHLLKFVASGDHRKLVAGQQAFAAEAPVSLVMVIDFEKFGSHDNRAMMMGCVDAGIVSQNINLYCQAAGLATVPRASMNVKGISRLLRLSAKQLPVMNNPIGFEKK